MSLVERRRPAFGRELLARAGLAWLMVCAVLLATSAGAILAGRFPDPDDALRLIQVRDLLGGQGWFDLAQHRIDAAHGGTAMHWSRLVDLPLAGAILLLTPLFGSAMAETIAIVAVPLMTLGVAMLLAGRIAWRLIGAEAASFACLAIALSVPVIGQMRPLRIDHHGWQIVLALVAVNALMARNPRKGGWIAGLALAVWLAISLEGLPMTLAVAAIAALRWLRARERGWLVGLVQGLAVGSAALFAATRGLGDLAARCDAVSPVHLWAFAWGAVSLTALARIKLLPPISAVAGFILIGGVALALFALAAPQCTTGTFDMLDPVVRHYWYDNVGEGLPVWRQDASTLLQTVLPPLVGLWACRRLAQRSREWLRLWWTDYMLLLGAALVLALLVTRAGAVAGALAAVPLGWQLREWFAAAQRRSPPRRRAAALTAAVLAMLPALPLTLLGLAAPLRAAPSAQPLIAPPPRASTCRIPDAAPALRALPTGNVLAPLDIGPRLLLETEHGVVATGHHRAATAMRAVIDAFTGSPERAREIAAAYRIDYVAFCGDLAEPAIYAEAAPHGFAAQLRGGRTPDWLEPVAMPAGVNLKVWKVLR